MITLSVLDHDALGRDLPLVLFVFEDGGIAGAPKALPPALRKGLLEEARAEGFKGGRGETHQVLRADKGRARRYLLAGLGKKKEADGEAMRRAAAAACAAARARWSEMAVVLAGHAQAAAEGLLLSSYIFSEYRKTEGEKLAKVSLLAAGPAEAAQARKAVERAALACEAVSLVRDLVNRGPSDKSPRSLADLAQTLKAPGVTVTILDRAKVTELGMGSFLGVARGSAAEPVFLHLVYKPKGQARRKVGLVGKGITFDSGGLSLKPPQAMEAMKCDMAGAANVLGVFKVLPRLKVRAEVHGFCAFTYNMPGPDAVKPGDVVRAMNGKTIEILNTDAEGRLVLADALAYASQQKLDSLIDLATLTGAVVTALGSRVTGVMGNNKALLRQLFAAAEKAGEPLCELPLVADYREQIKSSVADLQNIGKVRGEAGSIIGGLFLQEFVDGKAWVHCDIAGTAWADSPTPYGPAGGTGALVRTLLDYLEAL